MHPGTMGRPVAVAVADRRIRMDAHARSIATEERLRSQFMAALACDAACYRQFLTALGAHLRAFLRRRMTALPDDVEDLVQETLLAIHHNRHTYQSDQPLTAWVHTIARYKLIDHLRARARTDALNEPLDEDLEIFARSDHEAADARRDLQQMLAALPERQRRALVLVKLAGASVAETARETGMSEANVKVTVHRGLKALAQRFRSTP
jgi:RNA polymerase sigma-70 factor, ECF subfamily